MLNLAFDERVFLLCTTDIPGLSLWKHQNNPEDTDSVRVFKICESQGGHPWLPVPSKSPYGLYGCKATFEEDYTEEEEKEDEEKKVKRIISITQVCVLLSLLA